MRITKVILKTANDPFVTGKSVLFCRNTVTGYLSQDIQGKNTEEADLSQFILNKKDELIKSFLNKTLAKKESSDLKEGSLKKQYQAIYFIFEVILCHSMRQQIKEKKRELFWEKYSEIQKFFLKLPSKKQNLFFNHRFQKTKKIQKNSYSLIDELVECLKLPHINNIKDVLPKYQTMIMALIRKKSQFLAKSINNNKLDYLGDHQNSSMRKKALLMWCNELFQDKGINLSSVAYEFKLTDLVESWLEDYKSCKKYTESDIKNCKKEFDKKRIKNKLDTPKDPFEFKRTLKTTLQHHISALNPQQIYKDNPQLQQYSNEISKYLMHYFPLKASSRRLPDRKEQFEDYCSYYLSFDKIQKMITQQVQNALMQYILQAGKQQKYQLGNNVNSKILEEIKIKEAFLLQWINVCAFAASNLRNCIDPIITEDIVAHGALKKAIDGLKTESKKNEVKEKLAQFFTLQILNTDGKILNNQKDIESYFYDDSNYHRFIWGVRGAIQKIRNDVIHFKMGSLDNIFSVLEFELPDHPNVNVKWTDEITNDLNYKKGSLAQIFSQSIQYLPYYFAEKIKSAGLLSYYPVEEVKEHCSSWSLKSKPLAFVPSFKKTFNVIERYLKAENNQNNWLLFSTDYFFNRSKIDKTKDNIDRINGQQAQYNALEWIYRERFCHDFLSDVGLFRSTVHQLLTKNHEHAKQSEYLLQEEKWNKQQEYSINSSRSFTKPKPQLKNCRGFQNSFGEIINFDEWHKTIEPRAARTPVNYLIYIQSLLIQEENKKREDGTLKETETGNFQRFIYLLFAFGFNQYLMQFDQKYHFICCPKKQFNFDTEAKNTHQLNQLEIEYRDTLNSDKMTLLDDKNDSHIAFWVFCKLLDTRHLNELDNQLIKWSQAHIKEKVNQSSDHQIQILQEIIRIAILTNPRVPVASSTTLSSSLQSLLMHYISEEAWISNDSPYVNTDSTEKLNITIKNVELTRRYATETRLSKLFKEQQAWKVTEADIQFNKQKQEEINEKLKKKQFLHDDWLRNGKSLSDSALIEYRQCCEDIHEYQWINNKVTLVHIMKLHNLLIDILGRLAGFVHLFERDFVFYNAFLTFKMGHRFTIEEYCPPYNLKKKIKNKKRPVIFDTNKHSFIIGQSDYCLAESEIAEKITFLEKYFFYTTSPIKKTDVRNKLAHFNYLTETRLSYSLLDLIEMVRNLVSYDRKLKNSVTKSIISLFEQYNIKLKFKVLHENQHKIDVDIDNTSPVKIEHFVTEKNGKKSSLYKENAVHNTFCDMAIKLLQLK